MSNDATAEKAGSAEHGDVRSFVATMIQVRQYMWDRTVLRMRWAAPSLAIDSWLVRPEALPPLLPG
jgi:hypothetical protein